jgi:hypothetical protein
VFVCVCVSTIRVYVCVHVSVCACMCAFSCICLYVCVKQYLFVYDVYFFCFYNASIAAIVGSLHTYK